MLRRRQAENPNGTRVTIVEAAELLGVEQGNLEYLIFRGGEMNRVTPPRVIVSREHGQRIEYLLSEIEDVVARNAEDILGGPYERDPMEGW